MKKYATLNVSMAMDIPRTCVPRPLAVILPIGTIVRVTGAEYDGAKQIEWADGRYGLVLASDLTPYTLHE